MNVCKEAKEARYPLASISNRMASLHRQYFGKGPMHTKTYALDDIVVCLLRGGETPVEHMLRVGGRAEDIRSARVDLLQGPARNMLRAAIEELTGRRMEALVTGHSEDPDITMLTFVLEHER